MRHGRQIVLSAIVLVLALPSLLVEGHVVDLELYSGHVFDASTGLPLANATVTFCHSTTLCVETTRTDATGRFEVSLNDGFHGRVYVHYDDTATPGFDYVPAFKDVPDEYNLTFYLIPAGTLLVNGDIQFVDLKDVAERYSFTVLNPDTGLPPYPDTVSTFGVVPPQPLALDPRTVVVPAEVPVMLQVNATVTGMRDQETRSFVTGAEAQFSVSQGQLTTMNVQPHLFAYNHAVVDALYRTASEMLDELEGKGFYVNVEQQDLAVVMTLLRRAEGENAEGEYSSSNADLREAYLEATGLDRKLQELYVDAASSSLLLTVFLAFLALGLGSLLCGSWPWKASMGAGVYVLLLLLFVLSYPGVNLVEPPVLLQNAVIAYASSLLASILVTRFLQDHVVYIFSLAKQNVQRRRLRFFLTLTPVTVLAMSFVLLTSFTTGYGLTVTPQFSPSSRPDSLVARQPLPPLKPDGVSFYGIDPSTVDWFIAQSKALLVAPKAENYPIASLFGLGTLFPLADPSNVLPYYGVMGIQPNVETAITRLGESLVLVDGRLPRDGESGVVVSVELATSLGVAVGEFLGMEHGDSSMEVELLGTFEDASLRELRDLDGRLLIPEKVELHEGEEGTLTVVKPCLPSEVILMDWQIALSLQGVALSRIAVLADAPDSILSFARRIALERSLWVWSSVAGRVYVTTLAEYVEAKGVTIAIPWIIVLMAVVVTMLNAIYERRREVTILSSVGLNPSHIRGLFVAESAIIGIIGGGTGYMLGLCGYRALTILEVAIDVRQKISVLWSFGTLSVAVIAVVVGALIAIRYSVVITPSFLRKWTEGERENNYREPTDLLIPINPLETEVAPLLAHITSRIQYYFRTTFSVRADAITQNVKALVDDDGTCRTHRIRFNYLFGQGSAPFEVVATKRKGEETYTLRIFSEAGEIYDVATIVRMAAIEWSSRRR